MKFLGLIFFSIAWVSYARADVISFDDSVFGQDSITFDTDQDLAFLDLRFTDGRSLNDVSSRFGDGEEFDGFRVATTEELTALVNNWGFSPTYGGGDLRGNTGADQLAGLVDLLDATLPLNASGQARATIGMTSELLITTNLRTVHFNDAFAADVDDSISWAQAGAHEVSSNRGIYLVRSQAVPEPSSAISLISLVFVSLFYRGRPLASA